jgi:NADP-dependent 3-hydroxy acid dehydrogenase YdfG
VLDKITAPAIIRNGRMDLLAANDLGRAMHTAVYASATGGQPNFARFTFLDVDAAHDFYPRWEIAADTCVAILRTEAGRDPHDKDLHDLVGELSTRSSDFRRRWGSHDVRLHGAGSKLFHHALVGDLDLSYESVDMISDPGLTLTLYAAERDPAPPTHSTSSLPGRPPSSPRRPPLRPPSLLDPAPRPGSAMVGRRLPPVEHHRIPVGRDLDFTPEAPQPSPQRRSRTTSPSPNTARRRHLSMTTLAIVGAGTGLSAAVARRFGAEGFDVAVISRRQDRVDALAADLAAAGFTARGYAASVRDPEALTGALDQAANDLGPIEVLQYSPVPQAEFMHAVLDTTVADLTGAVEFSIYGPLTTVGHVLPGMRTLGRGTVLFVNGGSGARPNPKVAGTSIAFAGEGAYAAMLHTAVAEENIHVGQLIIPGGITPGHPTHDPDVLANRLWAMHTSRDTFRVFAEPMNL